jgi:hypothetical protein
MEISPSQVALTNIKHRVQKLLTLKQAIMFLVKISFFSPLFTHYRWISQFGEILPKKKKIVWPKPIG